MLCAVLLLCVLLQFSLPEAAQHHALKSTAAKASSLGAFAGEVLVQP
jgi:hypothetical protein